MFKQPIKSVSGKAGVQHDCTVVSLFKKCSVLYYVSEKIDAFVPLRRQRPPPTKLKSVKYSNFRSGCEAHWSQTHQRRCSAESRRSRRAVIAVAKISRHSLLPFTDVSRLLISFHASDSPGRPQSDYLLLCVSGGKPKLLPHSGPVSMHQRCPQKKIHLRNKTKRLATSDLEIIIFELQRITF